MRETERTVPDCPRPALCRAATRSRCTTGTPVGDAVFGLVPFVDQGGAAAEYAVLEAWAPKPRSWSFGEAGGAAGNIETATRVLEALDAIEGMTLLIEGATGGVGTITAQLARARGLTVIGTEGRMSLMLRM
jgi:NADPH:quinone reductase-like Zn-dependent oxidoreductase